MDRQHIFTNSGWISIITLLILLLIIGSITIAGGIFPNLKPPAFNATEVVLDEQPIDDIERNSLQLKTLKFKPCSDTITVNILIDKSGSMTNRTPSGQIKMDRVREALYILASKLTDTSIMGVQSFNSFEIIEEVPIAFYGENREITLQRINSLTANFQAQTPTHDGLAFSYNKLSEAIPNFPNRKFHFILISDGEPVPDTQDPRLHSPNPVDQIKNLGVEVFTLAIYDGLGQASNPALADLMRNIASTPENYLEARSADETSSLLSSITEKICD